MDNKKAKKAIAIYMCLWYNIIVPRERITKTQRKKIQENFQKGIDKLMDLWYSKNVPKRGQQPKKKILKKNSKRGLTKSSIYGIIRMFPEKEQKF